MRNIILMASCCLIWLTSTALAAGPDKRDSDLQTLMLNQKNLAIESEAPAAGEGGGGVVWAIIPEFMYGRHGVLEFDDGSLWTDKGTSKGFGVTFTVSKAFTDLVTLGFVYQFVYASYTGGTLLPVGSGLTGYGEENTTSNMAGLLLTLNFGKYGKLETSFLEAWDIFHGENTIVDNGIHSKVAPTFSDERATSLMAWYSIEFPVNDQWTLVPYAGWRSVYVVMNSDGRTAGNAWAHWLTGGLAVKYNMEKLTFTLRGGVNYRVSEDDIPGFSSRAVAPGITHLGYYTEWDRAIGIWGLSVDYVLGPCILQLAYDGYAGQDVQYHKGAAVFVFPF